MQIFSPNSTFSFIRPNLLILTNTQVLVFRISQVYTMFLMSLRKKLVTHQRALLHPLKLSVVDAEPCLSLHKRNGLLHFHTRGTFFLHNTKVGLWQSQGPLIEVGVSKLQTLKQHLACLDSGPSKFLVITTSGDLEIELKKKADLWLSR